MRYAVIFLLLGLVSCRSSSRKDEVESMLARLSEAQHDITRMPVYADPASGDYDELRAGKFTVQDSTFLRLITENKTALEPFIVQHIDSAPSFIYLAAYLKYSSAVQAIKHALLRDDYFQYYGWEKGIPGKASDPAEMCNEQLQDHEYPYQMAAIAAIEYISGKPLPQAVPLTAGEEAALTAGARQCVPEQMEGTDYNPSCLSCWLLHKFNGQPMPRF